MEMHPLVLIVRAAVLAQECSSLNLDSDTGMDSFGTYAPGFISGKARESERLPAALPLQSAPGERFGARKPNWALRFRPEQRLQPLRPFANRHRDWRGAGGCGRRGPGRRPPKP